MKDVLRKEIKYIVPLENFYRLKNTLEAVMEKDPYGDNGRYMVRTQYFDSVNWSLNV